MWSMPWIRGLPSLKPSTPPPIHYEDATVNLLMNSDLNSWNSRLLHSLLSPTDVAAVLSTPLYPRTCEDIRIWKATTDGHYSVKTAYRICIDLLHASTTHEDNNSWMNLWNLQVPHRVRSFLWRLAHQCLPTRTNLIARGIHCDDSCVVCEDLAETHMHSFFVCTKATTCWDSLGFSNLIRELLRTATDFVTMLFEFFRRLSPTQQQSAAMLLWSIWKSRNSKLWDATDTSSAFTVSRAKDSLQEWSCMQRAKKQVQNLSDLTSWIKPPVGMTKCNVDAATFHNNTVVGYGICFRNHFGQLLMGKSDFLLSTASVLEAEAIALLEALKMATTNGLHEILFETDSKTLVEFIKSHTTPQNEFGDLIIQCRSLLNNNPDFVVSFIRRQANRVAHTIARASLSHPSPHIFYNVSPTLYPLILNEMN